MPRSVNRVSAFRNAHACTCTLVALASAIALYACRGSAERVSEPSVGASAAATTGPSWRPNYERPTIVDVHAHLSSRAVDQVSQVLDANGIGLIVNLSGGTIGRGAKRNAEWSTRDPRIVNFANVEWRARNVEGFGEFAAKSLEIAVKRYGFKGLKISKALGLFLTTPDDSRIPVDWPELDPLWRMAGTLGVPVAIHTGDPKAFWEPVDEHNERYAELSVHPNWSFHGPAFPSREQLLAERERVIARHRGTTFICVHFGNNPEDITAVDRFLDANPNAVLDVSARLPEIGRHPADVVRRFFIKHQDRILFGTDLGLTPSMIMLGSTGEDEPTLSDVKPFYDAHWRYFEGSERQISHPTPIQGDWKIDAIALPEPVLRKLYQTNALKLLKATLPQRTETSGETKIDAPATPTVKPAQ